jgi:hypothetical protein
MNSLLIALLLLCWQMLAGWGLINCFGLQLKPAFIFPLSIIMGVAVFSIVPFLLQLFYISISFFNVLLLLLLVTLALNISLYKNLQRLKTTFANATFRIAIYEWPYLIIIAVIVFVSVWRCFYFPPTPSDVTTGAEAIAEYTIKEKTMINSVFSVVQNGNTLKPPFITCLQIIYKYAGFPFGQIWLSNIFISFIIILYHLLNATLHRFITGLLIILFLTIPEMYAYTFMLLYDYSSMVFFFLSVYFLLRYFNNQRGHDIAFAGLLCGIATYIRPETLLLNCGMLPLIWYHNYKNKIGFFNAFKTQMVFIVPTVVVYTVAVYIYITQYLPGFYNITDQVNRTLFDVKTILHKFGQTNALFISSDGIVYYGYFIFVFFGLLLLELIIKRKLNTTVINYGYAILLIYLFFPLLSHVLPGVSIENTVKRAFFKLFPLMLLCMANNALLIQWSDKIKRWELKQPG